MGNQGIRNSLPPTQQYHYEMAITGNEILCAFLQMQALLKFVQQNNFFDAFTGYSACVAAEVNYQVPGDGSRGGADVGGEHRGWPQP